MTRRTDVEAAATAIARASRLFVLTGAGMSAESGVPTFRGDGGLWRSHRPEELASLTAFRRDPKLVWEWYAWRQERVGACAPNAGHDALAAAQGRFEHVLLVTQNVDGLHQRAGSTGVIEMHGSLWHARCADETTPDCAAARRAHPESTGLSKRWRTLVALDAAAVHLPPPCTCGGLLRPHIVWFGEALDDEVIGRAFLAAEHADVLLSVGTSGVVMPAALLPRIASQTGATVIEVNPNETEHSDLATFTLRGGAAEILPRLLGGAAAQGGAPAGDGAAEGMPQTEP